jgi:uncharacterized zinc-type alcohol dehydrogenase-like protein
MNTRAYAAFAKTTPLAPFEFERREPGATDVQIEILYCGVCHSDIHTARSEWPGTVYPVVPGHEIVGRVQRVGKQVTAVKEGDMVGVGCMVDSCRSCAQCKEGLEQFCDRELTFTYNSPDKHLKTVTYGGYSKQIVVDQHFVLRITHTQKVEAVAPLLCAGITTYSPLKQWKAGKGTRVGVVGLGGLGHMAVKLAHALGAEVTLFSSSPGKAADAKRFGADRVVLTRDVSELAAHANSLDLILNTVASSHNLDTYLSLLRRDGTMVLLGAPAEPHPSPNVMNLVLKRRRLAGSLIGGIRETQEMLDFCAANNIVSDIELIPMQQINQAYERVLKSDVKYRFVIDMATL